jgi:hypothetical protein
MGKTILIEHYSTTTFSTLLQEATSTMLRSTNPLASLMREREQGYGLLILRSKSLPIRFNL